MKSDVYFIRINSKDAEVRLEGFKKLLHKLAPSFVFEENEFIPVKLTIGDSACVYNLNPVFLKALVLELKNKRAKPFLFDTCVIYSGERQNAVDHLNLAQSKGFGHSRVEAPFIIADGLFGQDGREYVLNEDLIKAIKVPSFIGMLNSLVVCSHVTGHIVSGFAAGIKNVAMGMSSRATKQVQHSSLKPSIIKNKCTGCGCCVVVCPVKAITLKDDKSVIDQDTCIGCGECISACKSCAVYINWHEDPLIFCKRMNTVANFILSKFKQKLFFNFAFDITKGCDCESDKNAKMIFDNCGIFFSTDVLSLDKATSDVISDYGKISHPQKAVHEEMFKHAAQIGLGNLEYNLIQI
ncbi:MAG: DUF362 domain-containing protein [Candidatus Omnitrophica bacterium]|nr:DUF362 domain-containing protein [Candidatus Omnitrophota bacterium]